MSDDQLPNRPEADDVPSRRGPIVAMILIVALVGGCLWLFHVLAGDSHIQDCVMAGRRNCAPISASGTQGG